MYWLPFAIAAGSALAGAGKKREAEMARKPTEIKQPEPFKEPEKATEKAAADLPYRPIPEAPSSDGTVANGLPGTQGYVTLNQTKANRASLGAPPGTPQDQLWTGSSLTPQRTTRIAPPGTMNRPPPAAPSIASPPSLQPGNPDDQLWTGSSLVPRRSMGGRLY